MPIQTESYGWGYTRRIETFILQVSNAFNPTAFGNSASTWLLPNLEGTILLKQQNYPVRQ